MYSSEFDPEELEEIGYQPLEENALEEQLELEEILENADTADEEGIAEEGTDRATTQESEV